MISKSCYAESGPFLNYD